MLPSKRLSLKIREYSSSLSITSFILQLTSLSLCITIISRKDTELYWRQPTLYGQHEMTPVLPLYNKIDAEKSYLTVSVWPLKVC